MHDGKLTLPLVGATPAAPNWHGWSPVAAALDAPEPLLPQGEYADPLTPLPSHSAETKHDLSTAAGRTELLAPAGGPEAGYAAFHFGADAIYLGLKKFSARAEAENFTLAEVDEITAYAHSLNPPRRVFVTINTLLRQDEIAELIECVASLADIGVDALIVQDLGVWHLVRQHFPRLELHASTQLAVHNRAGASVLHELGFSRVVLARELTFEEVQDITAASGIETEVFIHGALCYAYSGLCLFSSQTLGRSGNRGKCAYSCRDSYDVADAPMTLRDGSAVRRDPRQGFPFSMKDLALPDHIPALQASGVSCFKIEGRKKSPLYVATTTDYYRKLVDGKLETEERPAIEADLQTVFSRPWTHLFVDSHRDKEVADRDTVGHRGSRIGSVETVIPERPARLRFRTSRAIERHDGLQIDLPALGKPFGFAVEQLCIVDPRRRDKRQEVFTAPAGSLVEVPLPDDAPSIPRNAPVYCSSSQAVKQKYGYDKPKLGEYRIRRPVAIEVSVAADRLAVTASVLPRPEGPALEARREVPGSFSPARDPASVAPAARSAFSRLGATELNLESFTLNNPHGFFVPVSRLNQLRREVVTDLEAKLFQERADRITKLQNTYCPSAKSPERTAAFQWSLKVDRIGMLDALEDEDTTDIEEIVVDIARDSLHDLEQELNVWAARLGKAKLRLALPAITRFWEEKSLRHKIEALRQTGWKKWEAANLSAWNYLAIDPHAPHESGIDLATDWSVYVLNRLAAEAVQSLGVTRFALSPEDGLANLRSLLAEYAERSVVIVYQDTPLFVAESCAYANLIGGCPGKANCKFESMDMVSSHGERVTALDYHCRTIVLNQGPFCLSTRLPELRKAGARHLRADFVYRTYEPAELRRRWRTIHSGQAIPGGHAANFDRGIQ